MKWTDSYSIFKKDAQLKEKFPIYFADQNTNKAGFVTTNSCLQTKEQNLQKTKLTCSEGVCVG